jgi:deoxyribodipyrimidine photo-lyase
VHLNMPEYCTPFPPVKDHLYQLPAEAEAGIAVFDPSRPEDTPTAAFSSAAAPAITNDDGSTSPVQVRFAPRLAATGSSSSSAPSFIDWPKVLSYLQIDWNVPEITWAAPGERSAKEALTRFLEKRIKGYDEHRNDPTLNAQSNLSPWLHFGQLSGQRIVLELMRVSGVKLRGLFPDGERTTDAHAFAEELVVRRELADNFVFYQPDYDKITGASDWAQNTLRDHAKDRRERVYSEAEFEHGRTHEALWNAAQMQLVHHGKMHGFMRMYWAKKILEWSTSPEEALRIAIMLNDKYSIDGRDPNGEAIAAAVMRLPLATALC